jgi:hypothetical protein
MNALQPFETSITLCFTPPSRGKRACHTSPPVDIAEFADFAAEVVDRYVLQNMSTTRVSVAATGGR